MPSASAVSRRDSAAGAAGGGCCCAAAATAAISTAAIASTPGRSRRDTAASLFERVELVAVEVVPAFLEAVRPAHVDAIDARGGSQAEVHAEIVLRQVAAAAADLLPLLRVAGHRAHARADRVAV